MSIYTVNIYVINLLCFLARLIEEWKGAKSGGDGNEEADDDEDLYIKELKSKDDEEALREAMEAGKEGRFLAHVKVPTQKDIEEALLRRKKQELLELYAIDSTDLDQLEKEAKLEPQEAVLEEMETEEESPAKKAKLEDKNEKEKNGDETAVDEEMPEQAEVENPENDEETAVGETDVEMPENRFDNLTENPPGDQ